MRSVLSRILLVLLLGVAIIAAVRLGAESADTIVAFEDLSAERLRHEAFRLVKPARFAIDAAGSYEEASTKAADTTMAAYGWIVRRSDGAVVWRMRPPRPSRGTLVSVRDTIDLDAGIYDVYFASYGDPLVRDPGPRDGSFAERFRAALSRGGRSWMGDAGRWRFVVEELTAGVEVAETSGFEEDPARDDATGDSALVWAARGVSDHERREHLFQVTAPTRVRVRSTTEVTDGTVRDVASIVRLGRSDTVWTFRPEASTWAGGALKNRRAEEVVALEPGLYRAAFEADRSHAYHDWEANPPFAPWHWGMEVSRLDGAITSLDPTALDLPQIVGFECVGSDEEVERVFTLDQPTDVLLVAVGEIIGGREYDSGGLDQQDGPDGDDWEEVWEMKAGNTEPAGGDPKNRRAVVALSLDTGTYRLRYETDSSHDCGDGYNAEAPDGSLWGIVVYALDPSFDTSGVTVEDAPASEAASDEWKQAPDGLAWIDSVGNDEDRSVSFTLDEPGTVQIVAAGELSPAERFDYATLTDASGETVWEMTWENTEPAGGSSLNRRVDERLELSEGTYTVRYRTDSRHAFGSLGPDAPDDPSFWGVRVYAVQDEG